MDKNYNFDDLSKEILTEMNKENPLVKEEEEEEETEEVETEEEEDLEEEESDEDVDESEEEEDEDEDEDEDEEDEEDEDEEEDLEPSNDLSGDEEIELDPKASKANYAFKKMRIENKELGEKIKNLDEIAQRYGFSDHNEMLEQLEADALAKEAKKEGIDPKFYKEHVAMQKRIERMEREKEQEVSNARLKVFFNELNSFAKDYALSEKEKNELVSKMENDGITAQDVIRWKNPKSVFKGYVEDKIIKNAQQKALEKSKKKKSYEEEKHKNTKDTPVKDMDKLVEWSLKNLKKNNY